MDKLLNFLGSTPSPTYFFLAITLLLAAVLMLDRRSPEFRCAWATLLNFIFLVLTYFSNNSIDEVLTWSFAAILLCFYATTLPYHHPAQTSKAVLFFEVLVFIVMTVVFCTMFEHIYVVLCQHARPLLQGLLWLLGEAGVVDLREVNRTNIQAYHIIACLTSFTVLFSFSIAAYLTTPFILSSVRWVNLKCTKLFIAAFLTAPFILSYICWIKLRCTKFWKEKKF